MVVGYTVGQAAAIFALVSLFLMGLMLFISWVIRPASTGESDTYECGMPAEGTNREIGFGYMGYAVLFLVFDLAALFLFLYAVGDRFPISVTIGFFVGIASLFLLILYGTQRRKYYVT